ncbi:M48 family metallopeptidase [Leptospira gomenensis]|uniref:M48 family metallopeptidase n=1 Tax=Leptospira gomenensis TaxID=2484974 RepID=A0A5F1YK60_9LEPT|nr:M48 family metallopeptidase [Leptospira gomenensis]TGK34896.1 M48 family metallopeptidase [Leptospira gomenensis]TGK41146.1 M48 family metallopeptidase [Leptospira gomenensis]TGK42053.1 M48 family metallopeptidase [Leptospira gomenensis]TGK56315.1 M48 family metallopeptidase [Leptospira gomenensis]
MTDRLYDGKTASPYEGTLFPEAGNLRFVTQGTDPQTFHFSYKHLRSLEKLGEAYRLQFDDPKETNNDYILTFESEETAEKIRTFRKKTFGQGASGWFKRFLLLPVLVQILLAAIPALGIGYLLVVKLDRTYVFVPETVDRSLGELLSKRFETEYPECKNPKLKRGLRPITEAVLRPKDRERYTISVLKSSEVNAFALPGGTIYLFSGLLEESESPDEIAAVLAHEIAHVEKRHGIRQLIRILGISIVIKLSVGIGFTDIDTLETLSEIANTLAILRYSREFEEEADLYAFERLKKSGLGIGGFVDFFQREEDKLGKRETPSDEHKKENESKWNAAKILDWFSTHPDNKKRIETAKEYSKKTKMGTKRIRIDRWKTIREICN